MSKDLLLDRYKEKLNKNYEILEPYFSDSFTFLSALNIVKSEVLQCLLNELNIAAITCTNHFLERMLKLALIENEITGLKIDTNENTEFNRKVIEANNKYDGLSMYQSINSSFEKGLISSDDKDYLMKVKNEIRNSYSHSEMDKINQGKVNQMEFDSFSIEQVMTVLKNGEQIRKIKREKVEVSTKTPFLQSEIQRIKAAKLAFPYFENVYNLARKIDVSFKRSK